MGFGGFSGEMVFLFFLVLILFGPKRMPEIGRQVARILGEFRRASYEFRSQIEAEINTLDTGKKSTPWMSSMQAPLGTLANRILNPPGAEKREAAETPAVEKAAEPVAPEASAADAPDAEVPPAPKVAHDA